LTTRRQDEKCLKSTYRVVERVAEPRAVGFYIEKGEDVDDG